MIEAIIVLPAPGTPVQSRVGYDLRTIQNMLETLYIRRQYLAVLSLQDPPAASTRMPAPANAGLPDLHH